MMNATEREIIKALKTFPPAEPKTATELMWMVKDFYNGKMYVDFEKINYILNNITKLFHYAETDTEKLFWII